MPWNLLKYGLSRKNHGPAYFPAQPELKSAYDVVIIGAGGHGLAAAYYLAREGCEVTVVDRQPTVAAETSRANAGMISTGHALPWASPRSPRSCSLV